MKVKEHSAGYGPFYLVQGMFFVSLVIAGVYFFKAHENGPSVAVKGITKNGLIKKHHNDSNYALAISKRFAHEFYNWSHRSHVNAKDRASYYCSKVARDKCKFNAKLLQKNYKRLLVTHKGTVIRREVEWSDEAKDEFVILIVVRVKVWQAHKSEIRHYVGRCEIGPTPEDSTKAYRLEVKNYKFKQHIEKKENDT